MLKLDFEFAPEFDPDDDPKVDPDPDEPLFVRPKMLEEALLLLRAVVANGTMLFSF